MKEFLQEAYKSTKKVAGIDPGKPGNLKPILLDNGKFAVYKEALSEGLSKKDKASFQLLAENTRINLLENSMFQINPYETLTLPVLRVFYPKLIAREAVTVEPMNKPECVKAFLRAEFAPAGTTYPNWYQAPVMTPDISGGPSIGTPITAHIDIPTATPFNVLAVAGVTNQQAHLERDFEITGVATDGTHFTDYSIQPAVEGHFSQSVTVGLLSDVISGKVDYLNGTVVCSSTTGNITAIRYTVTCSLEENRINPKVKLYSDKVRLNAKDREISAEWTIHAEQDMRALFDISMQAEIINVLGQQVALDIDGELINALITANTRLNDPTTHQASFDKNPPVEYTWGVKYWHENIIPRLNSLSAVVYTDTNMGSANTILANPLDAAILEDLQTFNYTGTSEVDGDLGYRSATVAGGKWKVLVSSIVPQGQMVVIYKPVEAIKASFIYAPYVPAILTPYPLGPIPSLTILTRYATALVRSKAIAVLNITELN